jgi:DNA repair protein RecN (Recombination protein N)
VERRLEQIYALARKHRILPEGLPALHHELAAELARLGDSEAETAALLSRLDALSADYRRAAARLGEARRKAARRLQRETSALLETLAMGQCHFAVDLAPRSGTDPHPAGAETVEFLISTNPGATPQPLSRIASGGELSRISLAIQVATASAGAVPSMVFDEVDVGIGGAVAEVVGQLLRRLAGRAQVLCVTHLPQVAAQAHQQLKVSKEGDRKSVRASLSALDGDARVGEVARMLGGVRVTEQTLAHAREMLLQVAGA